MPTQSNNNPNPMSTTIVDAFVSPPLPNWEQLRDLPEPSGPIPEDDEDDAIIKGEAPKSKEVKDPLKLKEVNEASNPKEVEEAKDNEQGDKGKK